MLVVGGVVHHNTVIVLSLIVLHNISQSYFILLYPTCQYFRVFYHIITFEVMKLKPLKEKISITIDSDLLEKLKQKAELDDRSLSQYINIVLKQHIKDFDEEKP